MLYIDTIIEIDANNKILRKITRYFYYSNRFKRFSFKEDPPVTLKGILFSSPFFPSYMEAVKRITYHTLDPYIFAPSVSTWTRERKEKEPHRKFSKKKETFVTLIGYWTRVVCDELERVAKEWAMRWRGVEREKVKGFLRAGCLAKGRAVFRAATNKNVAMPSFLISSLWSVERFLSLSFSFLLFNSFLSAC